MVGGRFGMIALILILVAEVMANGRGLAAAQATRNQTLELGNGETLAALMRTSSKSFSFTDCVDAIRSMRSTVGGPGDYPEVKTSFPPDSSFVPPGAEEWCRCLEQNEPPGGIPTAFEEVFDKCRDEVLIGSDFNAMDICRGMMKVYQSSLYFSYTTFCARDLCKPRSSFNYYNFTTYVEYSRYAYDLVESCEIPCMQHVSAGYCNKYRLTYGGWVERSTYRYSDRLKFRRISVDGSLIGTQSATPAESTDKPRTAQALCDALYPTGQERCCSYGRAAAMFEQCCYEDGNGNVQFDCATSYGGERLFYNCLHRGKDCDRSNNSSFDHTPLSAACRILIDYYVAHPEYRKSTLVEIPDGKTAVQFSEEFMSDFCGSTAISAFKLYASSLNDQYNDPSGSREYCCFIVSYLFQDLVANCLSGPYQAVGPARLPLGVAAPTPEPTPPSPTPAVCDPCSFVNASGACESVCSDHMTCVVRKGKPMCVRCNFFRQFIPDDPKASACCVPKDDSDGPVCRSKRRNRGAKLKCRTTDDDFTRWSGKVLHQQPFTISRRADVCKGRRNFWVNRALCKVRTRADGTKKCRYISDTARERIAGGL